MHIVSTESDTLPVLPSNHLDLVLYVALYAALYSMLCTLSCTLYAMLVHAGASAAPSFSTWIFRQKEAFQTKPESAKQWPDFGDLACCVGDKKALTNSKIFAFRKI